VAFSNCLDVACLIVKNCLAEATHTHICLLLALVATANHVLRLHGTLKEMLKKLLLKYCALKTRQAKRNLKTEVSYSVS